MKVISWNLLRQTGATVENISMLIDRERPDLLLLQEATNDIEALTSLAGGNIRHMPMPGRIYGLAAWTPGRLEQPTELSLPVSSLPGRLPRRIAQIVQLNGIAFANIHLSHGQRLNRRQLTYTAASLEGPAAIIGDFNAVGPIFLRGFTDIGPRRATHRAANVVPFRLDRCLARGLRCTSTGILDRGRSDHCPIVLDLATSGEECLEAEPVRMMSWYRRR
ncbi:MAG: endonuclease/exonuclease/phosphatase family protein [Alphaproteobacteria bacterium]